MMRLITLAVTAAAIALPAMAQPPIRVPTAGKSPEQLRAAVTRAANSVCWRGGNFSLPLEAHRACVHHTVAATYAKAGMPQPTRLARR